MTMPDTGATESLGDAGERTGGGAREQIREVKDQVVGQARNTLRQARDRAGSSLGESKGQLAEQVRSIAEALRRTTESLRSEDQQRMAGLTETLARQVDQVEDYLRNKDARGMRDDLENLARRQPALVIGGALVLGLIGARFLKSSQRGRRRGDGDYGRDPRFSYPGSARRYSGYESEQEYAGTTRAGYSPLEGGVNPGGGYAGA